MKNWYETRLRKNKTLPHEIRQEKTKRYYRTNDIFNNGLKLNTHSENKRKEIKSKELEYDKHSLINSFYNYNRCIPNNDSSKNKNSYNNHSLFDSNKQKIIKPQNSNNCVQFFPKNQNINIDKIPLYNLRNIYISDIKPKYVGEYHNQYLKKMEGEDKYEKKINNIKNKDKNQINNQIFNNANKNYSNKMTLTNNSKTKNSSKDNQYSNKSLNFTKYKNRHPKNFTIHNRNKFFNFSNNLTEVNSNYDDLSPNKSISKYRKHEYYIKENKNDNINDINNNNNNNPGKLYKLNENNKCNSRNKENRTSSFMAKKAFNSSTNIYNKRSNRLHIATEKYANKTNKNSNKDKLKSIMPIELNIGYTNKEKLSRLKSIIEKSSANHNFFQIDFPNNIRNKAVKSEDKKNYIKDKKENNEKMIFKKKKIKMRLNEENKDDDLNLNNININKNYENNYLMTSPTNKNNAYKRNVMLNNGIIKDNNQIQSLVASYNLFVQNEKQNLRKNNENKLSSKETDHTSHLNNNKESKSLNKNIYKKKNVDIINNNDDTISLSYSKEQDISLLSKNKKNEDRSICLPFLQEHFNITYNKYNKQLTINDKNKYDNSNNTKNGIFIDSDDDDYQLTKEIILLKRGLAKKNELSREIKRKIRKLRPERVYNFSLLGSKRIYKKKSSNYRSFKFYM